jgi:hypothetical protein
MSLLTTLMRAPKRCDDSTGLVTEPRPPERFPEFRDRNQRR